MSFELPLEGAKETRRGFRRKARGARQPLASSKANLWRFYGISKEKTWTHLWRPLNLVFSTSQRCVHVYSLDIALETALGPSKEWFRGRVCCRNARHRNVMDR